MRLSEDTHYASRDGLSLAFDKASDWQATCSSSKVAGERLPP